MSSLEDKKGGTDLVVQLLPAIQVFVQTVRLCAPSLVSLKKIDLAVDSSLLMYITDLTAAADGTEQ